MTNSSHESNPELDIAVRVQGKGVHIYGALVSMSYLREIIDTILSENPESVSADLCTVTFAFEVIEK